MASDDERTVADGAGRRGRAATPSVTGERYQLGTLIGSGGMGDVFAAEDHQLGREVAVKRMQTSDPDDRQLARFLREARIQGKLQHPAIAPVHELGRDSTGLPFFVMKKLAGTTLATILERGDREKFPRQRLLRAFVDVCFAVEYAHVHKIIHRDLKPANVMLGEFGEVYVLDWGIAKVIGETDERFDDVVSATGTGGTAGGVAIGTRGYMSPEQAGGSNDLDERTDVFALGRVLAEILARDGEQPPELEALCARATEFDRDARPRRARDLADVVQHYLDGDRDLALRRKLASEHLEIARVAFAAGDRRPSTLREAARALALDPQLPGAAELVGRIMLEPPRDVPPEVVSRIAVDDNNLETRTAGIALRAHLLFAAGIAILAASGATAYAAVFAAGAALSAIFAWTGSRGSHRHPGWVVVPTCIDIAVVSRMFSPVVAAMFAALATMMISTNPRIRGSWFPIALAAATSIAACVPFALERAGILAPTFQFADDGFALHSFGAAGGIWLWYAMFAIYLAGTAALGAGLGRSMRGSERELRHRLQLQAWQLAQLVPS